MLSLKESLKILKETDALVEGHFILSSGLHSSKYIQCAKLMSKPAKAHKLCLSLAEKIKNEYKNFDLILSPAMGGIVIGYEIGRLLEKETIFAERVNGKFELRRGFKIQKNQKISAKPGTESKHDKLLQIYVTKTNAYVCIFVDEGLGGTVNNSQSQKSICCVTDEFSAINCLRRIRESCSFN